MKIFLLLTLLVLSTQNLIQRIPLYGDVKGDSSDYYYLDTISLKENSKIYIEVYFYDYWGGNFRLKYKHSKTCNANDFSSGFNYITEDSYSYSSDRYSLWDYKYKFYYTFRKAYDYNYLLFIPVKNSGSSLTFAHRSSTYYWILYIVGGVVVLSIIIFAILYARRRRALMGGDTIIVQPGYQEPIQPTYPAYGTPAYI